MRTSVSLSPQQLAAALGGEAKGDEVRAPGPGHSPKDRSLSIRLGADLPDGFVTYSHAGDDPLQCKDYVRERAGLGRFEPTRQPSNIVRKSDRKPVAKADSAPSTYIYKQADGTPYLRVKRTAEKKFFQSHWNGSAWIDGGPQGPPVPYRLPELVNAKDHYTVVITEGEKDVDNLIVGGWIATTNPGGATNWSADLNKYFEGRSIIILPDNDLKGEKHAAKVVENLKPIAREISVLRLPGLPEKGDVSDWLEAGGTFDDLAYLMSLAPSADEAFAPSRDISWPQPSPIKSTLPAVEPFIPEFLPDALRDYVIDVADRQQAPPDFAAVAAICGIAAIVGNRVRIQPKRNDDWTVVPNLWGGIIGRPSAMKSPAMQSALAPVYALQDEVRKEWENTVRTAQVDAVLSKLDEKDTHKRAEKAIKGGDREGARNILAGLSLEDETPPCPRIVVNDATVEKLGELLNENPRGLLLVRDELPGFLAKMEREEFQSDRAFYLEAFNGDGQFTYDRIGRGTIHIENCTLSIIGGVQPSRIAPIVRGAMTGESNDGLVQRLQMAVWPDDVGSWTWVDRKPNALARLTYDKTFRDLHNLEIGDADKPAVLRFSPGSQELFREWMTEMQSEARGGSLPSTLESHILKMPKTIASLALLFELIDGGRSEVNEAATRRALGWAEYLRSHANRLYSSGEMVAEDGARMILERRHQLPTQFTARHVYRKHWASLGDTDAVAAAIETLVATNHCREISAVVRQDGGRPSVTYVWNPALAEAK